MMGGDLDVLFHAIVARKSINKSIRNALTLMNFVYSFLRVNESP